MLSRNRHTTPLLQHDCARPFDGRSYLGCVPVTDVGEKATVAAVELLAMKLQRLQKKMVDKVRRMHFFFVASHDHKSINIKPCILIACANWMSSRALLRVCPHAWLSARARSCAYASGFHVCDRRKQIIAHAHVLCVCLTRWPTNTAL
jgi:hypothetical protein